MRPVGERAKLCTGGVRELQWQVAERLIDYAPEFEMNIHSFYQPFLRYFRGKRMAEFYRLFGITPETRVLDVGGTIATWQYSAFRPRVTLLNLSATRFDGRDMQCVVGDGQRLPFEDGAFDVAFSNSVIEHLGDWGKQQSLAREIVRVARYYYVQTPNRWFFVEPHLITPFIHFLPRSWQRRMLRNCTVWGLVMRPTAQQCDQFLTEVRLLSETEMELLFADAKILREKVVGMTKSIIAVRPPSCPSPQKSPAITNAGTLPENSLSGRV
jgi:Methyltransferase domain